MSEKEKAKNIYQRMVEVNKAVGYVAKNVSVRIGGSGYKAVGESDLLAAVNKAEAEAGLWSYQSELEIVHDEITGGKVFVRMKATVRIVNIDNPAEFVDATGYGDGIDQGDKACGKAATYANKYALMKAYKLPTGDDPDAKGSDPANGNTVPDDRPCSEEQALFLIQQGAAYVEKVLSYRKKSRVDELTYTEAQSHINAIRKKQAAEAKGE